MIPLRTSLRQHWPEYLIEAVCLGLFMISAGVFSALLEYPNSPVRHAIPSGFLRRALGGLAMGLTAVAIIYSPWGARSGAHMNPAVTWTFFRLGKVKAWDALFYPVFQTFGGLAGVLLVKLALGRMFTESPVMYVVTVPGEAGVATAFFAEVIIACGMMLMVLCTTNNRKLARFTGLFGGTLVFLYITFEAPLSGMSINPARTFASALPSGIWSSAWIYFSAPLAGMLLAAEIHHRLFNNARVECAKWNHDMRYRCIFCGHPGVQPDDSVTKGSAALAARAFPLVELVALRQAARVQRAQRRTESRAKTQPSRSTLCSTPPP